MATGICTEHSGVCVNIANLKEQTELNTKKIETLSDAIIKLTILVEAFTNPPEETAPVKQAFWDENTKKYAIRLGFILCAILIFALVGTNLIEHTNLTELLK